MVTGLVIKAVAGHFYVEFEGKVRICNASTKLKQNKQRIITGDYVNFDEKNSYITSVEKRIHELIRPKLANVKDIILVFSSLEPKMNFNLLDKMIVIMEINSLNVSIAITKTDLMSENEITILKKQMNYYTEIGYNVYFINENKDFNRLNEILKITKFVFTGQTGVGKSTLINRLIPDLDLKTNEISKALGRGKHTTREVTFFRYNEGYIIDTPGFSALTIDYTKEQVRDNFIEFFELSKCCKFNGCYHVNEPKCAVKDKIGQDDNFDRRHINYIKILNNLEE